MTDYVDPVETKAKRIQRLTDDVNRTQSDLAYRKGIYDGTAELVRRGTISKEQCPLSPARDLADALVAAGFALRKLCDASEGP